MNTKAQRALRRFMAGLAIFAALASTASAASLAYTLQGVKFSDGTAATGNFVWDTATSELTSADIFTHDGILSPHEYTLGSSVALYGLFGAPLGKSFSLQSGNDRYLSFVFDAPLSGGGVDAITITGLYSPGSYECDNCILGRSIVSGSVIAAVPEPETYTMLLGGLGLVGAIARRRTQRV